MCVLILCWSLNRGSSRFAYSSPDLLHAESGGLVPPGPIDTLHRVHRRGEVLRQRRHHRQRRRQHPYCIHGSNKNIAPAHVGSLGPPAAAGLDQKSADIDIHR